jgi:hypothetical protein
MGGGGVFIPFDNQAARYVAVRHPLYTVQYVPLINIRVIQLFLGGLS